MPNSTIETSDSCEEAETRLGENRFDTFVVNLLMPGYSSSSFVKGIFNHDDHPLMVGFSADKMSDAYDPKKGIKIKPLRKLFELETLVEEGEPEILDEELEGVEELDDEPDIEEIIED
jgi:DNA-binding NtrC family response regulator